MSDAKKPMNCPKNKWILVTICSAGNEVFRCKYVQEGIKKEENNENKEDDIFAQKASLSPPDHMGWNGMVMGADMVQVRSKLQQAPDHQQKFAPPYGAPFDFPSKYSPSQANDCTVRRAYAASWKKMLARNVLYERIQEDTLSVKHELAYMNGLEYQPVVSQMSPAFSNKWLGLIR